MPYLNFDLNEIWEDLINIFKDSITHWTELKKSPPHIRHIDASFVTILNKENTNIGCFVPYLYEIAMIHGLKAQHKEKQWLARQQYPKLQNIKKQSFYSTLYHPNGRRKSPFELAVLPIQYSDDDNKSFRNIQNRLENEINFRIENKKPIPPTIYRLNIKSDYLKNIQHINLYAGISRSIKLNILNPEKKTSRVERLMHYLVQVEALFLILIAMISITYSSFYLFLLNVLGTILAKWCAKQLGAHQLTETIYREAKSLFSKDFGIGCKISVKKAIKTLMLLGALLVSVYAALISGWHEVLTLPLWNSILNYYNQYYLLVNVSKYFLAGFSALMAALNTFVIGYVTQNYFWGIGVWDKQIDFTNEKEITFNTQINHSISKLNRRMHKINSIAKKYVSSSQDKNNLQLFNYCLHKSKSINHFININHNDDIKYKKRI